MRRTLCLLLFLPLAALAQSSDDISFQRTFLLRNASGTAANPGPVPHHPHLVVNGDWSVYFEGAAFLTSVSETGPAVQEHDTFGMPRRSVTRHPRRRASLPADAFENPSQ